MASFISTLREKILPSSELNEILPKSNSSTSQEIYSIDESESRTSSSEYIPKDAQAGELSLDETASGGLGRHLGLFSTTFLMYVIQPCEDLQA